MHPYSPSSSSSDSAGLPPQKYIFTAKLKSFRNSFFAFSFSCFSASNEALETNCSLLPDHFLSAPQSESATERSVRSACPQEQLTERRDLISTATNPSGEHGGLSSLLGDSRWCHHTDVWQDVVFGEKGEAELTHDVMKIYVDNKI